LSGQHFIKAFWEDGNVCFNICINGVNQLAKRLIFANIFRKRAKRFWVIRMGAFI